MQNILRSIFLALMTTIVYMFLVSLEMLVTALRTTMDLSFLPMIEIMTNPTVQIVLTLPVVMELGGIIAATILTSMVITFQLGLLCTQVCDGTLLTAILSHSQK